MPFIDDQSPQANISLSGPWSLHQNSTGLNGLTRWTYGTYTSCGNSAGSTSASASNSTGSSEACVARIPVSGTWIGLFGTNDQSYMGASYSCHLEYDTTWGTTVQEGVWDWRDGSTTTTSSVHLNVTLCGCVFLFCHAGVTVDSGGPKRNEEELGAKGEHEDAVFCIAFPPPLDAALLIFALLLTASRTSQQETTSSSSALKQIKLIEDLPCNSFFLFCFLSTSTDILSLLFRWCDPVRHVRGRYQRRGGVRFPVDVRCLLSYLPSIQAGNFRELTCSLPRSDFASIVPPEGYRNTTATAYMPARTSTSSTASSSSTSPSSPSSSSRLGLGLGVGIAALVVVVGALVGLWCISRRRKRQRKTLVRQSLTSSGNWNPPKVADWVRLSNQSVDGAVGAEKSGAKGKGLVNGQITPFGESFSSSSSPRFHPHFFPQMSTTPIQPSTRTPHTSAPSSPPQLPQAAPTSPPPPPFPLPISANTPALPPPNSSPPHLHHTLSRCSTRYLDMTTSGMSCREMQSWKIQRLLRSGCRGPEGCPYILRDRLVDRNGTDTSSLSRNEVEKSGKRAENEEKGRKQPLAWGGFAGEAALPLHHRTDRHSALQEAF
jgi:hypothetical protein